MDYAKAFEDIPSLYAVKM